MKSPVPTGHNRKNSMEYRCISADCHIDLTWLPHDLFVANASQAMKERMPYVIHDGEGLKWVTRAGLVFGFAQGKGSGRVASIDYKYVPGSEHRIDRMASTGLYDDGAGGIFRPTT